MDPKITNSMLAVLVLQCMQWLEIKAWSETSQDRSERELAPPREKYVTCNVIQQHFCDASLANSHCQLYGFPANQQSRKQIQYKAAKFLQNRKLCAKALKNCKILEDQAHLSLKILKRKTSKLWTDRNAAAAEFKCCLRNSRPPQKLSEIMTQVPDKMHEIQPHVCVFLHVSGTFFGAEARILAFQRGLGMVLSSWISVYSGLARNGRLLGYVICAVLRS